jgi:putative membrane protein
MMWIVDVLVTAGVLVLLARLMASVDIRNYGTAVLVALVIGLLNATVGWVLRGIGNILTLGLLSFFIRLVVSALVIMLTDKLFKGFHVKNFTAAVVIASVLAVIGALMSYLFYGY